MDKAYGGVVINQQGQVLLREPRGHYDGYVWTFAKGRPEKGETPLKTALREVKEETGIIAVMVVEITGSLRGSTTDNEYFLMAPVEDTGEFGAETKAVQWVTQSEAQELILKTTNSKGKERDLRLLKAGFAAWQGNKPQGRGVAVLLPKKNLVLEPPGRARRMEDETLSPQDDAVDWQPGDEFSTVGAIRNGDIVYFHRVAQKKFLMKTLTELESAAFQGRKYRVQRGEEIRSFELVAV